jgi:DNA-binding NtrC family response regulator
MLGGHGHSLIDLLGTVREECIMEKKKHILIADIDGGLLTRLAIFFEDKGYETTTAWGGREALEQLYTGKFEVVLLSDYLPDVASAQIWHAIGHLPGKPAIALMQGAQPGPEIAQKYLTLGGHCILRKESPGLIVESLHKCLSSGNEYSLNLSEPTSGSCS